MAGHVIIAGTFAPLSLLKCAMTSAVLVCVLLWTAAGWT
jgi:hypothetical protein